MATETVESTLVTDEEIEALIDVEDAAEETAEAKDDEEKPAEGEAPKEEPAAEPSDEEKQWDAIKKLGVKPQDLIAYANKGWTIEQELAAQAEKEKTEAAAKPADKSKVKVEYATKDEVAALIAAQSEKMQRAAAGSHIQTRLAMLLDNAGLGEGDAIGRKIVTDNTVKAIASGTPLDAAFKQASKDFQTKIDSLVAKQIRKKIEAKRTGGQKGTGAGTSSYVVPKMEHKATDFDDGTALKQAMAIMEGMGGRR